MKSRFDIPTLASNDACFDLQFRKDTRHERLNAPTYYRWKVQFVITGPKGKAAVMERVKKELGCGRVHLTNGQARFSVQNINDITDFVVPFFKKNHLSGSKKKEFDLWQRAVSIVRRNKGKYIATWGKNDLLNLIHIHRSAAKYKHNSKPAKWIEMAHAMAKTS